MRRQNIYEGGCIRGRVYIKESKEGRSLTNTTTWSCDEVWVHTVPGNTFTTSIPTETSEIRGVDNFPFSWLFFAGLVVMGGVMEGAFAAVP